MPFGNEMNYNSLTKDQTERFYDICDALRFRGYLVRSYPIVGQEEDWLEGLKTAIKTIDEKAEDVRKAYRCRGWSKNLRKYLYLGHSEPYFGVSLLAENTIKVRQWMKELGYSNY